MFVYFTYDFLFLFLNVDDEHRSETDFVVDCSSDFLFLFLSVDDEKISETSKTLFLSL